MKEITIWSSFGRSQAPLRHHIANVIAQIARKFPAPALGGLPRIQPRMTMAAVDNGWRLGASRCKSLSNAASPCPARFEDGRRFAQQEKE
jgi:hypothetical protein